MRGIISLILLVILAVGISIGWHLPKHTVQVQPTPVIAAPTPTVDLNELYNLTNKDRVDNGIAPLKHNPLLDASASAKCQDMVVNNYFAHVSPSGVKLQDIVNKYITGWSKLGENLSDGNTTAQEVDNAFMNSAEHRDNILNPSYTDVGFATCEGTGSSIDIFVVEHFAMIVL